MGKPSGFMEYHREGPDRRPVQERVRNHREFYLPWAEDRARRQGARCMNCAIPFCHNACPLGNLIPDWNDLVYRGRWDEAIRQLHATNNFPDFTGRVCPAPCEASCTLSINSEPVTIEYIEKAIAERAWQEEWIVPEPPPHRTGKKVAVVGSGPSGLAAAAQLNRAGHWVTVFERNEYIGGLLRLGIPDFKLEKWVVQRRVDLMTAEGVKFVTNAHVGRNMAVADLRRDFDAIVLTAGCTVARDLPVPGRELQGVHLAMEYLTQQNRRNAGQEVPDDRLITARGKRVVVLGGGDTGSDCVGTAHRQGAASVTQFELLPEPPHARQRNNPWPEWPIVLRTTSSHEEGGVRDYNISTKQFTGENGHVKKLHAVRLEWGPPDASGRPSMKEVPGSAFEIDTELVLLALGFVFPEREGMLKDLGVELDARGNVKTDKDRMTSVPGVFAAGDMHRGQSLVVWAIAEGRQAASGVDRYLVGATEMPAPLAA